MMAYNVYIFLITVSAYFEDHVWFIRGLYYLYIFYIFLNNTNST